MTDSPEIVIPESLLNGVDPELYLREVLERIADHPITRISELLPWNISTRPADLT
jgi:transposase